MVTTLIFDIKILMKTNITLFVIKLNIGNEFLFIGNDWLTVRTIDAKYLLRIRQILLGVCAIKSDITEKH